MIEKKTTKGNLEKRRGTFLLVGLAVVLAVVYTGIELYASSDKPEVVEMVDDDIFVPTEDNVLATDAPPPPPPPPAQEQQEVILEIVDDEIEIETDFDFSAEFDEDAVIEEIVEVEVIEEEESEAPAMRFVEVMPEMPAEFYDFLRENLTYPPAAYNAGVSGIVQVEFIVEKDGRVSNAKALNSVFPEIDKEAIRIVMLAPKWKPAKQNGQAVRCYFQIPISFVIN